MKNLMEKVQVFDTEQDAEKSLQAYVGSNSQFFDNIENSSSIIKSGREYRLFCFYELFNLAETPAEVQRYMFSGGIYPNSGSEYSLEEHRSIEDLVTSIKKDIATNILQTKSLSEKLSMEPIFYIIKTENRLDKKALEMAADLSSVFSHDIQIKEKEGDFLNRCLSESEIEEFERLYFKEGQQK